jgi:hypothetical protein
MMRGARMSPIGTKRTFQCAQPMSAFGGEADMMGKCRFGVVARPFDLCALHEVQRRAAIRHGQLSQ